MNLPVSMKKILVVDDDNILRKLLKHFLEKQGYQVKDVGSGGEGLVAFAEYQPDLIVSDISMPEMDGFEFCQQLRSQPQGQIIPFIFLSAKNDLADRVLGHSLGADDYLTKPFEVEELLAKIQGMLARSDRIHAEIVRLLQKVNQPNPQPADVDQSTQEQQTQPEKNPEPLPLTPAEERVFWQVIQGLTNKQISQNLFISPRTVQTHLSNILAKLNLKNRGQLIRFAYEQGYEQTEND